MSTSVPLQLYDRGIAYFDTELSLAASSFTGSAVLIGTLTSNPVVLLVKNQTSVPVFFADNSGSSKGTTMAIGEEFILDCRTNRGEAASFAFPIGTQFYATGAAGTGTFKVSVISAR
jgi:hypothetical protein